MSGFTARNGGKEGGHTGSGEQGMTDGHHYLSNRLGEVPRGSGGGRGAHRGKCEKIHCMEKYPEKKGGLE